MQCQISGVVPEDPVVTRFGHIYERSVIVKYIHTNGKCPVTGEPLSEDDLIALKVSKTAKPRPVSGTSIPGMLQQFQNEWDAVMLETYTLRQHLEVTRQELAQALYQHDAALRVIARLGRERDEARAALATATAHGSIQGNEQGDAMEVDREVTDEIKQKMTQLNKKLTAARRKRQAEGPSVETIQTMKQISSYSIHKASEPGVLCVDIHPIESNMVVTGGSDKSAVLFDRGEQKKVASLEGHTKKVNRVLFHPKEDVIISASADKTARVWRRIGSRYDTSQKLSVHTASVTDLDIHPLLDYVATSSQDETWGFHDIRTGICLARVVPPSSSPISSLRFHPDGLLLGTGMNDSRILMWDVKSQSSVAAFSGHTGEVSTMAFSENGFFLVSGSADGTVRLWDLRNSKNLHTYSFPESPKVQNLDIDWSGNYLAAATSVVTIFQTKTLQVARTLDDHSMAVTGVKWTRDSTVLASTSMDRTLRFYSQ